MKIQFGAVGIAMGLFFTLSYSLANPVIPEVTREIQAPTKEEVCSMYEEILKEDLTEELSSPDLFNNPWEDNGPEILQISLLSFGSPWEATLAECSKKDSYLKIWEEFLSLLNRREGREI